MPPPAGAYTHAKPRGILRLCWIRTKASGDCLHCRGSTFRYISRFPPLGFCSIETKLSILRTPVGRLYKEATSKSVVDKWKTSFGMHRERSNQGRHLVLSMYTRWSYTTSKRMVLLGPRSKWWRINKTTDIYCTPSILG